MHTFNETAWRLVCEQAAHNAHQGSRQFETMLLCKLHSALEPRLQQLEPADQSLALAIAQQCGYVTDKELKDDSRWNAAHGCCIHGIDPYHCPAGCGDLDEYDDLDKPD